MSWRSRVQGVLDRIGRLRSTAKLERFRRPLLGVATALFVVVSAAALANLPPVEGGIRWPLFLLAAAVVPLGVAMNAAEYAVSADLLGYRVRFVHSLRVALVAAAVNLLPVPGSVLVRTGALRQLGSGYGKAFGSTVTVSLGYLATGLVLAGGFEAVAEGSLLAFAFLASGTVLVGVTYVSMARYASPGRARILTARLVAVEVGSVLSKAARLYFVILALGYDVTVAQAVALTLAAVVASAIGIFPGGLGLREVIAGAISPAIGLPAAVGLVGASVDRVVGLSVLGLISGALAFVPADEEPPSEPVESAEPAEQ